MPKIHVIDVEGRWDRNNEDEWLWWPRVMFIDPGVVSGVSIIWFDPIAAFNDHPIARQIIAHSDMYLSGPEDGQNGQANRFLRMHKALSQEIGTAVGVEKFVPRRMEMDPEFLSPVRIRAKIDYGLSLEEVPVFEQQPGDAMHAFTNDRLKVLGLHQPGPDHINDARRHALLWIRKLRSKGLEFFKEWHGNEEGWWN